MADDAARCRPDALVLFGATGDLSSRMILPALARLQAEERIAPPIVTVGRGAPGARELAGRVRTRLARDAPGLVAAFDALAPRIRHVAGDLADAGTYEGIRAALAGAAHPLHYLAIPPALFATVARSLRGAGLADGARIAFEKPFGHDLASARALQREVERAFPAHAVVHVDHFLAKDPVRNVGATQAESAWLAALRSRDHVRCVQLTMAEAFGVRGRGRFYEATGVLRDVLQNHLLRVVAIAAMEPAAPDDADAIAAARIEAMRAIRPLAPGDVVYGQYEGYRDEPGVAPDSRVPTFVAVRLAVDTPRWRGVPFYVRAGKRLAVTTTMLSLDLVPLAGARAERVRFRLGPGPVDVAIDSHRRVPGDDARLAPLELRAPLPPDEDRDAYVNVLRALLRGTRGPFERTEGVFAAWRIVDPVLASTLDVHPYAAGSFGPAAADRLLGVGDRWFDPR